VNRERILIWCKKLETAWINKNIHEIMAIFSSVKTYYEDPFSPPGVTSDDISSYWEEISYQEITELKITPLAVDGLRTVLHWYLDFQDTRDNSRYTMDGVYLVDFDEDTNCINFCQWWVVKE
jgi:hypothetical protein